MVLHNSTVDPYSPNRGYYECLACGRRETDDEHVATCRSCGGDVHNIAVPRE